jgi:hypothetical protein
MQSDTAATATREKRAMGILDLHAEHGVVNALLPRRLRSTRGPRSRKRSLPARLELDQFFPRYSLRACGRDPQAGEVYSASAASAGMVTLATSTEGTRPL